MTDILQVFSEIGPLKKVLLHRPGKEIEHMTPQTMATLLFDDIPYAEAATKEHDAFAMTLRKAGVEVEYTETLLEESLMTPETRDALLTPLLAEAGIGSPLRREALRAYLDSLPPNELVEVLIGGITTDALPEGLPQSLEEHVRPFAILTQPMPNLYFMRDPLTVMGNGVAINRMATAVRQRETLLMEHIFRHHPVYGDPSIPKWGSRDQAFPLEGGDILVLSEQTLAVGISQRTQPAAIEALARRILSSSGGFSRILAVDIPKIRAFMHLDTVLTQVDRDLFVIHPEIEKTLTVYELTLEGDALRIASLGTDLATVFGEALGCGKVRLIPCAGGHPIHAPREQWNDGSNTLCVRPGEAVVYTRNYVTNDLLDRHGIKLYEIDSSELSRGRGGPRCMSMPLIREPLN